jgi:hypothetical protein
MPKGFSLLLLFDLLRESNVPKIPKETQGTP